MNSASIRNPQAASRNAKSFSHLYIERAALPYADTALLQARYPNAVQVLVNDYKDVFNRTGQQFQRQKQSMKLILAVKKAKLLYPGSGYAPDFGCANFYYAAQMLNCVYNCDYCYLQGMYPSANLVIFVNQEDYFAETAKLLDRLGSLYLAISYDTDLMAYENILPLCRRWIDQARVQRDLLIELRTKSANYNAIREVAPCDNVILAWTMSPDAVVSAYEKRTPPLSARLSAAAESIADGWRVRLCFDPMLRIAGWRSHYEQLVEKTFAALPADRVHDCSIGVFRMNAEYLTRIRKQREDSDVLYHPFTRKEKAMTYAEDAEQEMLDFMRDALGQYVPADKIDG